MSTLRHMPSGIDWHPHHPAEGAVLQRTCACGGTPGPTGECAACRRKRKLREGTLQTKLRISRPGDRYEREADQVAAQVTDAAAPEVPPRVSPLMQPTSETRGPGEVPPDVQEVLASPGRSLDAATRTLMESRFRYNFGAVRVHADARAARSAQVIDAQAYTVGRDVAFGPGAYAPRTAAGQRLLAHELTHVVQQGGSATPYVQREPDDKAAPAPRKDVVALLSDTPDLLPTAATLSPDAHRIQAGTPEELAAALKKISFPIGTLYFFSHSLPSGDLGFSKGNSTTYVLPSKLATALNGSVSAANAPQHVDFRGCSLGTSPQGMDQIRSALGAGSAVGGNCFMIHWPQGPVSLDGKAITKPSQVKADDRASFEKGLKMLADTFGQAKKCIIDTSEEAYFRAGGKYVALWSNPDFDTTWDERKSICYKDLSTETATLPTTEDFSPGLAGHCKLVRIAKPAPPAPKKTPQ